MAQKPTLVSTGHVEHTLALFEKNLVSRLEQGRFSSQFLFSLFMSDSGLSVFYRLLLPGFALFSNLLHLGWPERRQMTLLISLDL